MFKCLFFVIKTLDPEPDPHLPKCWIRIRFETHANSQHCVEHCIISCYRYRYALHIYDTFTEISDRKTFFFFFSGTTELVMRGFEIDNICIPVQGEFIVC